MNLGQLLTATVAVLVVGTFAFLWQPALEDQVERCEQVNANITPTQSCQTLWWGWWGVVGFAVGAITVLGLNAVWEDDEDDGSKRQGPHRPDADSGVPEEDGAGSRTR